jgi:hypothetical protein
MHGSSPFVFLRDVRGGYRDPCRCPATSCLQSSPGINRCYRQDDFDSAGKNFADFFNFAILRQVRWLADNVETPRLKKRGKLANSILFLT